MNSASRYIVCVLNGSRAIGTAIEELLRRMREQSAWKLEVLTTSRAKEAIELVERVAPYATHIVAVGGDGTIHEVVNGMQRGGSSAVLGILPNGTGNDYQRNFGKWELENWWETFVQERVKLVDLCRVDSRNESHFSVNIAGCGFDGHVVRLLDRQRENWKMSGKVSYATAIVRAFFSYRKPHIRVKATAFEWEGKALMLVACKGSTFGHGLVISPDSRLDDGRLQVVLLGRVSLLDYIRNLSKLRKGKKISHSEAHYFSAEEVKVEVVNGQLWQESDGELGSEGSLRFSVLPSALRVLQSGVR